MLIHIVTALTTFRTEFRPEGVRANGRNPNSLLQWHELRRITLCSELMTLHFGDTPIELNLEAFPHYRAGTYQRDISLQRRRPSNRRRWVPSQLVLGTTMLLCSVAMLTPLPIRNRGAALSGAFSLALAVQFLTHSRSTEFEVVQSDTVPLRLQQYP